MRTRRRTDHLWPALTLGVLLLNACAAAATPPAPPAAEPAPTSAPPAPPAAEATPTTPSVAGGTIAPEGDFWITAYQGADVLGGESVRLSDLLAQGRPVVVSLVAGSCPLCHAEMPHLEEAYQMYGEDVLIVAVDIGTYVNLGDEEDARAMLAAANATLPAGGTPDASLVRHYQVLGTPATLFFQPDGTLFKRSLGVLTVADIGATIGELMAASKS